jgi:hypothetical protein
MVFFCSYSLYGGEIFIATSYLEEFNPEYYLVHDLSGKTILYGSIKKKHYQSGLAIPLGNDIDPAFALTLLKKGIYRDKETFQAQSFK